ncbi:hypothetical protein FB451DRAFT_1287823 [Mycena latifolia]|nr:hypothetical protein FB451DRAFT_1287823 [Mycena latifolia]
MKQVAAGATAVEKALRDVGKLAPRPTPSAAMKTAGNIGNVVSVASQFQDALGAITSKLEPLVRLGDEIATIHPYVNTAWKVLTSVYQAAKDQQDLDDKVCKLVQTMVDVYSFVEDIEPLADKMKRLEDKAVAIGQQTVECALFIQEYTGHGFCSRAVRNTWKNTEEKIDNLSAALINLKESFNGSMTVQVLFISSQVLKNTEDLVQSDMLRKLNPVDKLMNATSRTTCLPGTRQKIMDEIHEWVTIPSNSGNVLWLSGVAGTGKSTISTTISETFRAVQRLGAFLFFDRNDRVHSHPDGVIHTVAYSLALSNPHIGAAISNAIQRDHKIMNAPIRTQFKELLLEPLQSVEKHIHGAILVVLDALDECGDPHSRADLLEILATELPKMPHFLRFVITSRGDADISNHFGYLFARRELDTATSGDDVQLFIYHEMDRIGRKNQLGAWVDEQQVRIQVLVNLAGGLFIWAFTAVRFIDGYLPNKRLEIVVTQNSTNIDTLYSIALQDAGPWNTDETFAQDARAVLTCVVLGRVPMTDGTIDRLIGYDNDSENEAHKDSAGVLKYLGCVVQWSPGHEARTLHASFADYLTDPNRSAGKPWAIDLALGHRSLALGCLRVLNSNLPVEFKEPIADVPDISPGVSTAISPHLSYSSCFWFIHMQEAPSDQIPLEAINKFFKTVFLHWLELSLLDQIEIISVPLRIAVKYIQGEDIKALCDFGLDPDTESVEAIMTPIEDLVTLSTSTILDDKLLNIILSSGHSHFPVHEPNNTTAFIGLLPIDKVPSSLSLLRH